MYVNRRRQRHLLTPYLRIGPFGKIHYAKVGTISTYITDLVFKQIKRFKDRINQERDKVIHDFLKLDYEPENLIYAFVSFVEQDIDIGQEFNRYWYRNNPKAIKKIECRICTIINPLVYLPVDKIAHGHKAICVLQFNSTTKERF